MKQISIIATLLLLSVAAFFACKKQAGETEVPLDEAQFIETEKGQIIRFSEEEDFTFSSKLAAKLGFSELSIKKGTYDINTTPTDYGTVVLNVKSYTRSLASGRNTNKGNIESSMSNENVFGIRIAKRKKKTCGGEPVTCTCCCGIEFRCGTTSFGEVEGDDEEEEELQDVLRGTSYVSASSTPVNPRRKKAHFTFNESAKTLTIHFIEKVDWKAMN